ncbi:MAG TPA: hypothetical protein PLD84_02230 [Chitinophagales bacterium]|nr:hypothetical protein [Chitinophagales bacterium]
MKIPSKSWDEKLREKISDYESTVPDDLFKTVIKKREQRKWIAALRKRSRSLWLLLLLLIPFTCHYVKNSPAPVIEILTTESKTVPEKNQSAVSPVESNRSVNNVSPVQSGPYATTKKIDSSSTTQDNQNISPTKSKARFSDESIGSGNFHNTSKISKDEKSPATSEEYYLFTASVDAVSKAEDNTSVIPDSQPGNTEIVSIPVLPLNNQKLYYEKNTPVQMTSTFKIDISQKVDGTNDSAAEIEISPTSWDLHWSAEAFFSPDLSFQQLTDHSNDSLTLTDWNRRMEKSFTTGLRFSLNFDGGFFLKSGLTYSKEQASFTLQKTWAVPVILDSTYYYTVWHPFEDPQYVFYSDTTITSRDSVASYASSITYSFLNIPLLVGYTFDFNKFHIGVQSGVIFNAQFSKQGSSIDPQTLEPVSLPENNTSFFRNRASMSFYAGIENEYRFNEHIGIFAEPYFQMQPKPVTTDAAPVEQRLHKFGLNTGIKFSF